MPVLGHLRRFWRVPAMSAYPLIVLQKSFCTGDQKFRGPQTQVSCKDVRGASSSSDKLTGDFGNEIAAISISDIDLLCFLAGKLSLFDFELLQQYRHLATNPARPLFGRYWG